jgi:hypothetical protein
MCVSSVCYPPLINSPVAPESILLTRPLNGHEVDDLRSSELEDCQDGSSKAPDCLASNLPGFHVGFGSAYSSLVIGRASMGRT